MRSTNYKSHLSEKDLQSGHQKRTITIKTNKKKTQKQLKIQTSLNCNFFFLRNGNAIHYDLIKLKY